MANTKISALSAVASVVGTNEFAVNEAGTSKKVTATQIASFVSPTASDTVPGILEVAVQAEQETGADTTRAVSPGRQVFHPSAAKFWMKATGASTTIVVSFNMTSWANGAVGDYDGTIATDFSSENWCAQITTQDAVNAWDDQEMQRAGFSPTAQTATAFGVLCSTITDGNTAACSLTDPEQVHVVGFGDR